MVNMNKKDIKLWLKEAEDFEFRNLKYKIIPIHKWELMIK